MSHDLLTNNVTRAPLQDLRFISSDTRRDARMLTLVSGGVVAAMIAFWTWLPRPHERLYESEKGSVTSITETTENTEVQSPSTTPVDPLPPLPEPPPLAKSVIPDTLTKPETTASKEDAPAKTAEQVVTQREDSAKPNIPSQDNTDRQPDPMKTSTEVGQSEEPKLPNRANTTPQPKAEAKPSETKKNASQAVTKVRFPGLDLADQSGDKSPVYIFRSLDSHQLLLSKHDGLIMALDTASGSGMTFGKNLSPRELRGEFHSNWDRLKDYSKRACWLPMDDPQVEKLWKLIQANHATLKPQTTLLVVLVPVKIDEIIRKSQVAFCDENGQVPSRYLLTLGDLVSRGVSSVGFDIHELYDLRPAPPKTPADETALRGTP